MSVPHQFVFLFLAIPEDQNGIYPPENPWKNLLTNVPDDFVGLVKTAAKETTLTLQKIIRGEENFNALFTPRPKLSEAIVDLKFSGFMIRIRPNNKNLILPECTVNSTHANHAKENKGLLKVLTKICSSGLASRSVNKTPEPTLVS